jgi:hypothetical protein
VSNLRRSWIRRRAKDEPPANRNRHSSVFRSDNDLRQWRTEWPMVTGMTVLGFSLVDLFDLPLPYAPLGLVPPLLAFLLLRWSTWHRRKTGKRFSAYDDEPV